MATLNGNQVQLVDYELSPSTVALDQAAILTAKMKNISGETIKGYQVFLTINRADFGIASQSGWSFPLTEKMTVNLKNGAAVNLNISFALDTTYIATSYAQKFLEYQALGNGARAIPLKIDVTLYYADSAAGDIFVVGTAIENHYELQIPQCMILRAFDYEVSDEGTTALTYIELAANDAAVVENLSLKLYYARNGTANTESAFIDLTENISYLLNNPSPIAYGLLEGQLATTDNWDFLLVFTDGYEPVEQRVNISRAFANVHMAGASTGGVAFGKFSSATEGKPLFECVYPAVFSGDVTVPVEGLLKAVPVTVASAQSVPASTVSNFTSAVDAGDGWTPIGVVGYSYNSRHMTLLRSYLNGDNEAACTIFNGDSSARSVTIVMYVLCMRTG